MSITPKIIDSNKRENLRLHMRIENSYDFELKGSINFIINLLDGRKKRISKKVKIPKKTKKDFLLTYKIDSSFSEGFYRVLAFFSYDHKKIYSLNKENDFFCILDTKKNFNEKEMFKLIKNSIVLKKFKRNLNIFLKQNSST
jgi:hypothetical protein